MKQPVLKISLLTGTAALCALFASSNSFSQIVTDGTVGPGVSLPGPNYEITESIGKRVGANLFHSFSEFNIGASQSATFTAASGPRTDNIISRVTGTSASYIDGALRSTVPGADVWLMNP
ncbi:MAG: filamentous hemagglutinin N-terminal domain-containing protein, partial [Halioglobus sp.]